MKTRLLTVIIALASLACVDKKENVFDPEVEKAAILKMTSERFGMVQLLFLQKPMVLTGLNKQTKTELLQTFG